jgi:class 3 adenylate cyclase
MVVEDCREALWRPATIFSPMDEFPRGTVTFLATDIQGSTEMWERYPDAMPRALERHEHLLREAVETRGGRVFKNVGDGLFIAFSACPPAVDAAGPTDADRRARTCGPRGEEPPSASRTCGS